MAMFRTPLVLLLTALLALWPVGAPGHARYFCRMMDRVMDSCCCGSKSAEAVSPEAELRNADCCVRLSQGALSVAGADRDAMQPLPTLALPETIGLEVHAAGQDVLVAMLLEDQPLSARGPPLFLKNCVFLI